MSTTIELPTNGPTSFDEVLRGDKGAVGPLYERMRAANPFFSSRFDGWVFTRYEDVRAVLADERAFPPLTHGAGTTEVYGRNVLQLSGQAHADVVAPVARALRPNARLQGEIRDVVEEVAEQYALHLMRADGPVDLRREIFSPYPMAIIAALMGLPTGAQFRSDYGHVVRAATSNVDGDPDIRRAGEEARSRVFGFLRPYVEERLRGDTGDDLLGAVCQLLLDGAVDSIDEVLSNALFLFIGGVETTERTLTNLMWACLRAPGIWQDMVTDRSLIEPTIIETLRMFPPVHAITRGVAHEVSIGGQNLKPGDRVMTVLAAANRDAAVFENPDAFDPERFRSGAAREFTPASTIISFGTGTHHCTGSRLSKLEMETMVSRLIDSGLSFTPATDSVEAQGYVLRAPAELLVHVHKPNGVEGEPRSVAGD